MITVASAVACLSVCLSERLMSVCLAGWLAGRPAGWLAGNVAYEFSGHLHVVVQHIHAYVLASI